MGTLLGVHPSLSLEYPRLTGNENPIAQHHRGQELATKSIKKSDGCRKGPDFLKISSVQLATSRGLTVMKQVKLWDLKICKWPHIRRRWVFQARKNSLGCTNDLGHTVVRCIFLNLLPVVATSKPWEFWNNVYNHKIWMTSPNYCALLQPCWNTKSM